MKTNRMKFIKILISIAVVVAMLTVSILPALPQEMFRLQFKVLGIPLKHRLKML